MSLRSPFTLMIAAIAALPGCGGGAVHSLPGVTTFSVGGTVSGLSGTVVLQDNGGDNLPISSNGPFTFRTPVADGATYSVTVATQPSSQSCVISNGAGTVAGTVSSVLVTCNAAAALGQWSWTGGADTTDSAGQYGSEGVPLASDAPGAREAASAWTDAAGNFWLFGGFGYDSSGTSGMLNDVWKYSPSAGEWTWVSGSDAVGAAGTYGTQGVPAPGNMPGAREGAAAWTDGAGQLWLFGGLATDANQNPLEFNDLWKYQPSSGEWTWVSGSNSSGAAGSYGTQGIPAAGNMPPARAYALTWVDSSGVLWLFGGAQYNSSGVSTVFNDLWNYNPSTGQWTWVSGSSSPNAAGSYGTQGTPSGGVPGARAGATPWIDAAGNLWLLGGYGIDQNTATGELNDLWRYSVSANQWTWMGGASTINGSGVYGSPGVAAAGNAPGARVTALAWTDSTGNFWLFGGYGYDQSDNLDDLNDLWKYSPSSGQWTWMSGSAQAAATGSYGTEGVGASGNVPGAREQDVGWIDGTGNLWLFGGYGYDSLGQQDDLNDLWRFAP
jgi:N-acetylneuraminic acid mutarotase